MPEAGLSAQGGTAGIALTEPAAPVTQLKSRRWCGPQPALRNMQSTYRPDG